VVQIGVNFLEQDSNQFNDGYVRLFTCLTASLSDVNNLKKIRVYPNPTKGLLYIGTNNNNHKVDVKVYNIQGVNVLSASNVNKIDLKNLEVGIYILRIDLDGKIETYKILKM